MRTAIDPVRFLQNRSSGKMGLSIARALVARGARLHCLLGPVDSSIASQMRDVADVDSYQSASEYGALLKERFPRTDVFFSAAAVLDFDVIPQNAKRDRASLARELRWELSLRAIPDFCQWAGENKQSHQQVIAFAAETGEEKAILERAEAKRVKKHADFLVANPVQEGLGPDASDNLIWVLGPGSVRRFGPGPKDRLGEALVEYLGTDGSQH